MKKTGHAAGELTKEEREKIIEDFWHSGRVPIRFRGQLAKWVELRQKITVITYAIEQGLIDADELLDKYDLAKHV